MASPWLMAFVGTPLMIGGEPGPVIEHLSHFCRRPYGISDPSRAAMAQERARADVAQPSEFETFTPILNQMTWRQAPCSILARS